MTTMTLSFANEGEGVGCSIDGHDGGGKQQLAYMQAGDEACERGVCRRCQEVFPAAGPGQKKEKFFSTRGIRTQPEQAITTR